MQHSRNIAPLGRGGRTFRTLAIGAVVLVGAAVALSERAGAERLPPDPVEQFRQALKLEQAPDYKFELEKDEKGEALKRVLAFRKKNIEAASRRLTGITDLSRALLLPEWRATDRTGVPGGLRIGNFDIEARIIEQTVRDDVAKRFVEKVRTGLKSPGTGEKRGVALANLIGETMASASNLGDDRLTLYHQLAPLARDLARQVEEDRALPPPAIRAASARALGQFPTVPEVVVPTLERYLARDNPEPTRLAAATALATLVQVVSGRDAPRGSEPGVSTKESKPSNQNFSRQQKLAVCLRVVPVAGAGVKDSSPAVRQASSEALRQVAATFVELVPRPLSGGATADNPYPPRERPWSAAERKKVLEARDDVVRLKASIQPLAAAFAKQSAALTMAVRDPDAEVRLTARRALADLARTRRLLREFAESVPEDPILPGEARAPARPTGLPRPRKSALRPVEHRGPASDGSPAFVARVAPPVLEPDKDQAPTDPLEKLLEESAGATIRSGLVDPNVAGRRSALEVLELMGDLGAPYVPKLVKALADPDLFVRWIAARTLGRLAPRQPGLAVPGLTALLADDDLDLRIVVARSLGNYGPAARTAVPALTCAVGRGDAEIRIAALKALESIGTDSVTALPTIGEALSNIDPRVRAEAARVLGRFGKSATAQLPALRRHTTDPDADVRKAASEAILQITAD